MFLDLYLKHSFSLLQIKLMIDERVDILNKDLDQKLESLNRRVEQGEWKKLEEKATTILVSFFA